MRVPLAVSLESRDGGVSKDARVLNGIVEVQGEGDGQILKLRTRPGNSDVGLVKAGIAQLLYSWNGINTIQADFLNRGTMATIVSSPVQSNLAPANASIPWSAQETGSDAATPLLMIKNRTQAKSVNRAGTVTPITFASNMGEGTYNLLSVTRSGAVATATLAEDIFNVGDTVTIAGAGQAEYNGAQTVTAVTLGSYTPARDIPITITRVSTTATATTVGAVPHGLSTGTYTISGSNQSQYNGAKSITVTSTTQFTFTVTVTDGGGASIPITITRSGTTATAATVSGNHDISSSNHTIAGAGQAQYNGLKAITVTDPTHFTYTVTVTPEAPVTPATGSPAFSFIDVSVTSASSGGGHTQILNTAFGNTYVNGESISITGYGPTIPDGSYTVAGRTSSLFTITLVGTPGTISGTIAFTRTRTVSSITRSGTTATLTTSTAHGLGSPATIDSVVISGATQTEYNQAPFGTGWYTITGANTITYTVTVTPEAPATPATGSITVDGDTPRTPATGTIIVTDPAVTVNPTFTYTVAGTPATPATGTITVTSSGGTVPGIAYINGYFCVMDVNGVIWNSAIDDPTSWNALDFVTAQAINGAGKALAHSSSYLIALKEWSTEQFYDRQDGAAGSPFSPATPGFTEIGCASGFSVASVDGSLIWVSQSRQRGRGVYVMEGLDQRKISTPDVERILNADDLATVYAYGVKLDGHSLYLLTLVSSNITLVYDFTSQLWDQWSSYTIGSVKSVSSITRDGNTATVTTSTAHTVADGDPVKIVGATQNEYNGIFQAQYVSSTIFTIQVSGDPTTPATGTITAYPYTESYFKFTKYADYAGLNLLLHETDGHLYQIDSTLFRDAGLPINLHARSVRMDGGSTDLKKLPVIRVIADSVESLAMLRWSDDDCVTFSAYRLLDLSDGRPETRKCGAFRRRTFEFRHVGNYPLNATALEMETGQ